MTETFLLQAVRRYLLGAGLQPAPGAIGVVEPAAGASFPLLVLSLPQAQRRGAGLGERTAVMTGALEHRVLIDLAHPPVLADVPPFHLLAADRRGLSLPHGGLVRRDGTTGPLSSADLVVTLDAAPILLVAGPPAAGQVAADPVTGRLTFGAELPPAGRLAITYVLPQWERRIVRLDGVLRVDACSTSPADAADLADAVLDALGDERARAGIPRLLDLSAIEVGTVGAPEATFANACRRTLRFAFKLEHLIDRPDSSGGVIRGIPVETTVPAFRLTRDGEISSRAVVETMKLGDTA